MIGQMETGFVTGGMKRAGRGALAACLADADNAEAARAWC